MTDIATLRDLLARCERATGPSRALDTDMHWHFDCLNGRWPRSYRVSNGEREVDRSLGLGKEDWHWWDEVNAPAVTGSIEAATALIERAMPGAYWYVSSAGEALVAVSKLESTWRFFEANGVTPALGLIAAFLKAKIHEAQRAPGDAVGEG